MMIHQLSNGDEVHKYKKSLVVIFKGQRKVLSTSAINGGYQTGLEAVFNNDGNAGAGMGFRLRADSYEDHLHIIAGEDLGLDSGKTAGMCTAASMENASITTVKEQDFIITAIVTAGIEVNAVRIGDPASYSEKPGTINIILCIDAELTEGTMVKALSSCTEAKAAALQELQAASRYSTGLATGSGTDGVTIVCKTNSDKCFTDAGSHSMLGASIGNIVKDAVKEALYKQTGLCSEKQHDIIRRMERFGINEDTIWRAYQEQNGLLTRAEFENTLQRVRKGNNMVTYSSLYAHLLDQLQWGLLDISEVWEAGRSILGLIGAKGAEKNIDKDFGIDFMIERYLYSIVEIIMSFDRPIK